MMIDTIFLVFLYGIAWFGVASLGIYKKLYPNMCDGTEENFTKKEIFVICILSFNIVSVSLFVVGVVTGEWLSIDTSILLQNLSAVNNLNLFFLSSSTMSSVALKLVDKQMEQL